MQPAFFDRGIPDMVGYAEVFALDTSAAWAASRHYRYDDVVFVLPAWLEIYVTDGDRRMTFESARSFGDRVREVYLDLGYTIIEVPRDSVETRTRFIAEHVRHARTTCDVSRARPRITRGCSRLCWHVARHDMIIPTGEPIGRFLRGG